VHNAASAADESLILAQVVRVTEAEGPGRRFALWVQGCPLRCAGCCNPEMLSFSRGRAVRVAELIQRVLTVARRDQIEGITLLGGEPVAQAAAAAELAAAVQANCLTVMLFSGYALAEIRRMEDPAARRLLRHTDVLVDGPYRRDLPETGRRWVGSANQQVHFLSRRYRPEDPVWQMPNSIEIRLRGGELCVNGFPAAAAVGLWKRPGASAPASCGGGE